MTSKPDKAASDRRILEQGCPTSIRAGLGTPEGDALAGEWVSKVNSRRAKKLSKTRVRRTRTAGRVAKRHANGKCACGHKSVEGRNQCQRCIDRTWLKKASGLCYGNWKLSDMRFSRTFFGGCAYCGGPLAVEWDHVIPTSDVSGLGHFTPANLVPACKACNRDKRAQDLGAWLLGRPDGQAALEKVRRYQAECRQVEVPPDFVQALAWCNMNA